MKPLYWILFTLLTLAPVAMSRADGEMRTWTSQVGTTISAEFVEMKDEMVTLRTATGRVLEVPRSQLSRQDRALVNELAGIRESRVILFPPPPAIEAGQPLEELAAELAAAFISYSRENGVAYLVLGEPESPGAASEAFARHLARLLSAAWIRSDALSVVAELPEPAPTDARELSLQIVAAADHRNVHVALTGRHPATGEATFAAGGYLLLSTEDRRRLGFEPAGFDSRFLPILTGGSRAELDRLGDLAGAFVVEPPPPSAPLEEILLHQLLKEHFARQSARLSDGATEEPGGGGEPVSGASRPELALLVRPIQERAAGRDLFELRAVDREAGIVVDLAEVSLERVGETEEFLRRRAAEYLALQETGDTERALEICRWIGEGQRRTVVSSTRVRHENYLSRSHDFKHRLGPVRILGECAALVYHTTYADGSGSGSMILARHEGEWKVWSLSNPGLPEHRFTEEQVQQIRKLREWVWEEQGTPAEVREQMRRTGS